MSIRDLFTIQHNRLTAHGADRLAKGLLPDGKSAEPNPDYYDIDIRPLAKLRGWPPHKKPDRLTIIEASRRFSMEIIVTALLACDWDRERAAALIDRHDGLLAATFPGGSKSQ